MATSKRGKSSDRGQRNGGGGQSDRGGAGGFQENEGDAGVANRIREGVDSARGSLQRGYEGAEDLVSRNPAPSLLVSFGVGFGLGLVLCSLFARKEETWADRYLPDSLRNPGDAFRNLADQARHIPETISGHLPKSVRKYVG